jgi:hypothetical protein
MPLGEALPTPFVPALDYRNFSPRSTRLRGAPVTRKTLNRFNDSNSEEGYYPVLPVYNPRPPVNDDELLERRLLNFENGENEIEELLLNPTPPSKRHSVRTPAWENNEGKLKEYGARVLPDDNNGRRGRGFRTRRRGGRRITKKQARRRKHTRRRKHKA